MHLFFRGKAAFPDLLRRASSASNSASSSLSMTSSSSSISLSSSAVPVVEAVVSTEEGRLQTGGARGHDGSRLQWLSDLPADEERGPRGGQMLGRARAVGAAGTVIGELCGFGIRLAAQRSPGFSSINPGLTD